MTYFYYLLGMFVFWLSAFMVVRCIASLSWSWIRENLNFYRNGVQFIRWTVLWTAKRIDQAGRRRNVLLFALQHGFIVKRFAGLAIVYRPKP